MATKTKSKTRKKKLVAEVHTTFTLTYDSDSKEFKDTLEAFKKIIQKEVSDEDLILYVLSSISIPQIFGIIEGVGYISKNGIYPSWCEKDARTGIDMPAYPNKPYIDIISNDYI